MAVLAWPRAVIPLTCPSVSFSRSNFFSCPLSCFPEAPHIPHESQRRQHQGEALGENDIIDLGAGPVLGTGRHSRLCKAVATRPSAQLLYPETLIATLQACPILFPQVSGVAYAVQLYLCLPPPPTSSHSCLGLYMPPPRGGGNTLLCLSLEFSGVVSPPGSLP